ncbi:atherin-like [Panthera tigris]|uniref:atherin-like n=1 Tax=Panthera tigris TaxID=9694 RepID=UPI001C6FB32E|nr:atherin-like [Panthera tigris]
MVVFRERRCANLVICKLGWQFLPPTEYHLVGSNNAQTKLFSTCASSRPPLGPAASGESPRGPTRRCPPPPLPGRSPDPAPTSPQGVAAAAGSREEALRGWREAPGDAARLGPAAARGNSKGSRPHSLCRTGARIGAAAPAPHYLLRAAAAGGRRDRSGPCSPGSGDEEAATAAAAKDNQEPAGSAPPRRAQNARAQREPGPHLQPGCDGGRRLGLEDGLDSRALSLVGKRKQSRGLIGESSVAPLPLPSIIGSSAPTRSVPRWLPNALSYRPATSPKRRNPDTQVSLLESPKKWTFIHQASLSGIDLGDQGGRPWTRD